MTLLVTKFSSYSLRTIDGELTHNCELGSGYAKINKFVDECDLPLGSEEKENVISPTFKKFFCIMKGLTEDEFDGYCKKHRGTSDDVEKIKLLIVRECDYDSGNIIGIADIHSVYFEESAYIVNERGNTFERLN